MAYEKSVFVDGSESYNPNNIIESYEWKTLSEILLLIIQLILVSLSYPPVDKNFIFELTVRGPGNIIDKDTVNVKVYNKNIFPIAIAGKIKFLI